jgi:hypothetical protein
MAAYNDNGIKTFTAGGTIAAHARVKLSGGNVVVAVANEACIGFAERAAVSGDLVAVRLINHQGTFLAIAGEAVAVGGVLYGLAAGKVGDTDGGAYTARFIALTAGAGDGSIIEVLPTTLA